MIQVEQIRKSFNGVHALDGFSLRVGKGELVGLVGPNGAGKTTLIKILSTLLLPNSGAARIDGKSVVSEPFAVRSMVGYLADQSGLYQEMRVREFLEFFADAFHLSGTNREEAISSALSRARLEERSNDYVESLSFGTKQRLMLAKTLLHRPSVLLLDEPATGLDPLARTELREFLKELNSQGMTILISSHILADLEDICTHVALISKGQNVSGDSDNGVLPMRSSEQNTQMFELELLRDNKGAAASIAHLANVKIVEAGATRFLLAISGNDKDAAEVLRALVTLGLPVIRFDRQTMDLEQRYRLAFGGAR